MWWLHLIMSNVDIRPLRESRVVGKMVRRRQLAKVMLEILWHLLGTQLVEL